jgi:hypothetical protein
MSSEAERPNLLPSPALSDQRPAPDDDSFTLTPAVGVTSISRASFRRRSSSEIFSITIMT